MPWVPQSTRMARKLAHGSSAHELLCANFLAMRVTWNGLNRALENNQLLTLLALKLAFSGQYMKIASKS